ncbi:hypothetical protein BGZ94_004437 [Podila epigama]|nr:hypothetical protein BGZ94_004437 [Podila epigama]
MTPYGTVAHQVLTSIRTEIEEIEKVVGSYINTRGKINTETFPLCLAQYRQDKLSGCIVDVLKKRYVELLDQEFELALADTEGTYMLLYLQRLEKMREHCETFLALVYTPGSKRVFPRSLACFLSSYNDLMSVSMVTERLQQLNKQAFKLALADFKNNQIERQRQESPFLAWENASSSSSSTTKASSHPAEPSSDLAAGLPPTYTVHCKDTK